MDYHIITKQSCPLSCNLARSGRTGHKDIPLMSLMQITTFFLYLGSHLGLSLMGLELSFYSSVGGCSRLGAQSAHFKGAGSMPGCSSF